MSSNTSQPLSAEDREPCLEDVRVLEFGSGIGVRFCGMLLRQLGAKVVRAIDPAGVTPPPDGATELRRRAERVYFDHGKDVATCPPNSDEFLNLVRASDVILRGVDPTRGLASRDLRSEYEVWRKLNDALIYVALTPFGATGSIAEWSGGDIQAQALSGWVSIIGDPDRAPLSMNYGIGAMQQGLSASGATIAALIDRRRDGKGDFVDISEAQVIAASIRQYAIVYRWSRIPLRRSGRRAPGSSGRYPHTVWPCKDGEIMIILRSEVEWKRFIEMIGNPVWADEPRYQDFYAMGKEYPDEVDALIVPWMMEHTKSEISTLATDHGVPLAPLRTAPEVLDDEQLEHRRFFTDVEDDGATVRVPGLAARFIRPA